MLTKQIGKILVDEHLIDQEQLDHCLEYKKQNPKAYLGSILRHHGFINDHQLANCLSKQINWQRFNGEYVPDYEVVEKMGLKFYCESQIFPLKNGNTPSFVVSHVDNVQSTDSLRSIFGTSIKFMIGPECDVRNAIDLIVLEHDRQRLLSEIDNLKADGIESLSSWFNEILNLAIITRSSDIHIEPTGKTTDVRFRIDGILTSITCLKSEYIKTIANIALSRCKCNPGEYGLQDGRFEHNYKQMSRNVDIRFSQIPSINGPSIVLRLLDRARASIPLESLGYSEHNKGLIDQAIIVPHGLILVTGPTGSGKSTTLYAILNQIKSISKKIVTCEDPVEIPHSLMSQVEVDLPKEVTFCKSIRAFLRQDPNVMLIGEIRDHETAEECMRAANTGLQIFSTLHTNDPISAILRLRDLGVDAVNISSSLVAVVAQRLVRKLCPLCKTPHELHKQDAKPHEAKYFLDDTQRIFRANGCSRCRSGYLGRTVVSEVLLIDPEIKELIGRNDLGGVYSLIRKRGTHKTMIDDVKTLILKGDTSIDESVRVLG
jgi:type IV pilus assembly protein PilB